MSCDEYISNLGSTHISQPEGLLFMTLSKAWFSGKINYICTPIRCQQADGVLYHVNLYNMTRTIWCSILEVSRLHYDSGDATGCCQA